MNIKPTLKEFLKLSRKHNLVVLSHTFYSDVLTPVASYYKLSKLFKGESFLLESVEGEEKINRFSFLGFSPLLTFKSKHKHITVGGDKNFSFETKTNPLDELKKIIQSYKVAPLSSLRFFGGFVGYLGYDIVKFFEPVSIKAADPLNTFDSYFMLPQVLIAFDHVKHQIEILLFVATANPAGRVALYKRQTKLFNQILQKLDSPAQPSPLSINKDVSVKLSSNMTKSAFCALVKKAQEHIRKGDIIQVVPSQRFKSPFKGNAFDVYRYLRILNPSPYMFYLNFGDTKIAGSSPEMLMRCENNTLFTRPIAGTRKRGKNEEEDRVLEKELLADPKEKAEHIMLVDLARNDLGRVAQNSSVHVPIFMNVERFSHVMHIVSEVRARLSPKENIYSALQSCFPAGTVSGAPKVRAMQIIADLEPHARGIYAGSVGYFSFTNSLDTCIIIRTIVFKNGFAYIQAGAGIVNDSKPKNEYTETLNKARAQMIAVELARRL